MAGTRQRLDVWGISVQTLDAAQTQNWHPVLDGYARGVEAMMDGDTQLTVESWLWAANTHGIPFDTPAKPLWDECKHGQRFFLPWHRAYLAWFEATIRALINDETWALPYWNYSDPDRPETLGLPPEFRVEQRTVDGELVDNKLFVDLTNRPGSPVAENVEVVPAMSERFFVLGFPQRGFGGVDGAFQVLGLLEGEPHNFVHTDIGQQTGLMADPAVAARDPIFWLHHANIDRLWEVWRRLPDSVDLLGQGDVSGQTVSEWRRAHFAFGGNGAVTVYAMENVLDTTAPPLGYTYEVVDLPQAQFDEVAANRQAARGGPMGLDEGTPPREQWDPVAATAQTTDVGEGGAENPLPFDQRQLGLDASIPSGLIIALMGVRAADDCHNVYVVEVAAGPDSPVHHAGRVNTFGLRGTPADEERNYTVDATAVIPQLIEDGWNGTEVVVVVRPESPVADSGQVPGGIQIRQITVYRRP